MEEKKVEEDGKKGDESKGESAQQPQEVILKVYMHCEACAQEIKKRNPYSQILHGGSQITLDGDITHDNENLPNEIDFFKGFKAVRIVKSVMLNEGKTRFSTKDGSPIFHFLNTSTFSEDTIIDSAYVVKIDFDAPSMKMSLLSCGVSTSVGAAWNVADVQPGSSVVIFGLGAVGLARIVPWNHNDMLCFIFVFISLKNQL
ncbi:Detected protein of unknown function [Hibiscus syriacus]|uniref:Uncharacterized protein n=1 Tax=Hibiscus syriacus TaxID=106335 RepID=A0A6A3CGM5_HIBSY|nr:alcohol dehydrogenase 1-like [Hibiscus syriacus]KAE8726269.1 Detected protein of unknown function [Hibiscus syriacus]